MSKHFTSVLQVSSFTEAQSTKEQSKTKRILVEHAKTIKLQHPQPLPHSSSEPVSFVFDHVFSGGESELYRHSVKDVVENTLLGYHGTVISLGSSHVTPDKTTSLTGGGKNGIIGKAASQLFRCLKESRSSKSNSSTANLVVLCSFVLLVDEKAYDLLLRFTSEGLPPEELDYKPAQLSVVNGNIMRLSHEEVKSRSKVMALLDFGTQMKERILAACGTPATESATYHHTILTLTVEYAQFGSMNAPVSGNLSFVDVSTTDPLAHRPKYTTGDTVAESVQSLFALADAITGLTANMGVLSETSAGGSAFDLERENTMMPCVPAAQSATSKIYEKSLLTQLLKEAIGGNCKTLLISYVPDAVTARSYDEVYALLKLASRARLVQNTPNKRDLAEKALMSAYMRGLSEIYGQGWQAREEVEGASVKQKLTDQLPTFSPLSLGTEDGGEKGLSGSQDSIESDDIDTAYDQLIDDTNKEQRQRNVEMAATALFAAAMKKGGGGSGTSDEEKGVSDQEDTSSSSESSTPKVAPVNTTKVTIRKKKNKKAAAVSRTDALKAAAKLESPSSSSLAEQDVTIEALVAILQDPDKGVPRASTTALKDVKVHKDAGALFSGADIVQWMVENVDGVETEADAQALGQLLLEKGALVHTEGSRVFANATTLFYYAREARPISKLLSPAEIQALLSTKPAAPSATTQGSAEVTFVDVQDFSDGELSNHSDEELQVKRVVQNAVVETTKKKKKREKKKEHPKTELNEAENAQTAAAAAVSPGVTPPTPLSPVTDQAGVASLHETEDCEMEKHTEEASKHDSHDTGAACEVCEEDQQLRAKVDEEDQQQESTSEPNTLAVKRLPTVKTLENTENYPHPLHMAVAIGKSSGVVRQLVMMFGVDKLDDFKRTPLMFAALGNNKASSCSTLIECGADINRQDISGLAAVHVACYHGNKAALSALLSKRAAIDVIDNLGHTPLHWSTVPTTSGCLQLLSSIVWPALVKHTDRNGLTALHWAIYYDHPQHLKLLLKKVGDTLELDSKGRTLLIYALEHQAMQCAKVLLSANPALLSLQDANGSSPLHHASVLASPDFLQALLSHTLPPQAKQLDINSTNRYQRSPVHCAVAYNRPSHAAMLVGRGALLNVVDDQGKTPLDYAKELKDGATEMVSVLEGGAAPLQETATESKIPEPKSDKTSSKSKLCTVV